MSERNTITDLMKGVDRSDYNAFAKFGLPSISIPTSLQTYIAVTNWRPGVYSQYLLTLTALPFTITDALAYAGLEIIDLAYKCAYSIPCCNSSLTFTTTSAIASTLNSGVTVQYGLGSVTASATTLATTMIDANPGSGQSVPTFTSSTVINTAPAVVTSKLSAATGHFDGRTTAGKIFLNLAVGTGTDIDADATLAISGTIILTIADLGTNTAIRG